jgi:hypothetical protein
MSEIGSFEQWCVVEIMGHKKFAGLVTEQVIGGTSFVRIDVPAIESPKREAFTKLFGAGSIYCMTPCTEETARAFAKNICERAFSTYEAPRLGPPTIDTDRAWDNVDNYVNASEEDE